MICIQIDIIFWKNNNSTHITCFSFSVLVSKCLFNLYAEYIIRNAGLEETQAESRLPGEISLTSDMQMTPPLWQKVKKNSKAS